MNRGDLIAAGEAMHHALGREYYLTGSGLKDQPAFQDIYDRHAALQGDDALAAARASGSRELLEWIVGVRVGRAVVAFEEAQLRWEKRAVLTVDGQDVPYLRAPILLANTADRSFRIALDQARADAGAGQLNGIRRDRFACEHDVMAAIGYEDYVDGLAALAGIDLDALGQAAAEFLEASDDLYAENLSVLVRRRLGIPVADLVRADAAWTFRADRYDAAFPPERLLATATGQMRELGLDAACGGRIRFDTEERAGKLPRAFCVPVHVPEEVYLVLRPRGGHADYRTFWHELGHAMHFASVAAQLPFEARWLGDNSVTEGFAMLWDHLTLEPAWLARYTELSERSSRDLSFELGVNELYMMRRYAAKLCYELLLHRSDFTQMGSVYAELLSGATRFRFSEDDHLTDVDPGFYAARYLRAWQLEATLARALIERFDVDWYRNPAAGEFVRTLMARGQRDPAHEVARDVTQHSLTFAPMLDRLALTLS